MVRVVDIGIASTAGAAFMLCCARIVWAKALAYHGSSYRLRFKGNPDRCLLNCERKTMR